MKTIILFLTTIYIILILICINLKVEEMINQPHYSKPAEKYQKFQFRIMRYPDPNHPNDLGHISIDFKQLD